MRRNNTFLWRCLIFAFQSNIWVDFYSPSYIFEIHFEMKENQIYRSPTIWVYHIFFLYFKISNKNILGGFSMQIIKKGLILRHKLRLLYCVAVSIQYHQKTIDIYVKTTFLKSGHYFFVEQFIVTEKGSRCI